MLNNIRKLAKSAIYTNVGVEVCLRRSAYIYQPLYTSTLVYYIIYMIVYILYNKSAATLGRGYNIVHFTVKRIIFFSEQKAIKYLLHFYKERLSI